MADPGSTTDFQPEDWLIVKNPKNLEQQQKFLLARERLLGAIECLDRVTCEDDPSMCVLRVSEYVEGLAADFTKASDALWQTDCNLGLMRRLVQTLTEKLLSVRKRAVAVCVVSYADTDATDYAAQSIKQFKSQTIKHLMEEVTK